MADDENYTLKIEVTEVMKEIAFAVKHVKLSEILEQSDEKVFFNLETKEGCHYCIELTPKGFRVSRTQVTRPVFRVCMAKFGIAQCQLVSGQDGPC